MVSASLGLQAIEICVQQHVSCVTHTVTALLHAWDALEDLQPFCPRNEGAAIQAPWLQACSD